MKLNRRQAIRKHCLHECSNGSTKAVKECPNQICSLYPFRMGKGEQDPKERSRAIRKRCLWCMGRTKNSPEHVRTCDNSECYLNPFRMDDDSKWD